MANQKKINKILFAETKNKYYYPYQNWYFPLKRACKKIISFDMRWNHLIYGKKIMNEKFLEFVKKEKPDYIFMWIRNNDFYPNTLLKIREISTKTQTFLFAGDDNTCFEDFSRYLILFLDYGLIPQKKYIKEYNKDGIENVFFVIGLDTNFFKPLNLNKKYDVTFIGLPKTESSKRSELIKFLKDKGVKIKLFGFGWNNYPELRDIYGGTLSSDKMIEVLNQSKINLCFSQSSNGKTELKGKVFEAGACKTFVLTEFCEDYLELFKEGKEIVMFKDKEELLQKIKYYLKNEDEREKITNAAYKKVIDCYSVDADLKKIFKKISKISKNLIHKKLPEINKRVICLNKKDLKLSFNELENKLKNCDYVFFIKGKCQNLKYRQYLQAYSLKKTNKPISCCDYYVHSKILGDYLYFSANGALKNPNKIINLSLNINQFMVTKYYFLKNLNTFRNIFHGAKIDFITERNTAVVSFPLIRINKFVTQEYEKMQNSVGFNFLFRLFSLKYRKKLFSSIYPYALLLEIVKGKKFILKVLINALKDKSKKDKILSFEQAQN